MAYPSSLDIFPGTAAQGTSLLTSPDHSLDHRTLGSAVGSIEQTVGTTAGTSIAKNFAAGDFAARINSSSVLQQAIQGTINNSTLGTPTLVLGSDAQGDIFYRSSAGTLTRLAPGTSGQFLKTQGAGANPVWGNAGSGSSIYSEAIVNSTFINAGTIICAGTIVLVSNSNVFIAAGCDVRGTAGDAANFKIFDGTTILTTGGMITAVVSGGERRYVNASYVGTFAAGTHTFNFEGSNQSSAATVIVGNAQISIFAIPG